MGHNAKNGKQFQYVRTVDSFEAFVKKNLKANKTFRWPKSEKRDNCGIRKAVFRPFAQVSNALM